MSVLARLLIVTLLGASTTSAAGGQTRPRVDSHAIDGLIRAEVDTGFSGVVLVALGDSVVLRRGYGSREHHLTETSAFWIASITKSFTGAVIVALQQEGRLSVQDSLFRFFPAAPLDKRVITIHQLLTHTAGFGSTYTGGGLLSRTSAVRAILSQPLTSPPGQRFLYGDDDYELLAAVVEVVTGRSWENTIQRRILDPIGLTQTGFWCGPWRNVPRPVAAADGTRTECAAGHADWGHKGANGMSATADDLLRWTSTLWHFGRGASRFSAITSSHIFVRREGSREVHYGYGVRLYYEKNKLVEIAHTGSGDDGHTAIVRQLASGLTIIVLSNAGQHGGTTWSSYVATRLAAQEAR